MQPHRIEVVFFDIGETLGRVDATGHFVPFPSSRTLLETMKNVLGLRIGVMTNLPATMNDEQIQQMLEEAGLFTFLDPNGLVTNHQAQADKPKAKIYRFAAQKMGVTVQQCLFIGENEQEVLGAKKTGMSAILKPRSPQ